MVPHFEYTTRFYVKYNSRVEPQTDCRHIEYSVIEPVYKLLDFTSDPFLGKTLIIHPNKWSQISLIPVSDDNVDNLLRNGAELILTKYLYDDIVDAKIQLAYICSVHRVKPTEVFIATHGLLTHAGYTKLLNIFYADFPEKYV